MSKAPSLLQIAAPAGGEQYRTTTPTTGPTPVLDSGLLALTLVASYYRLSADVAQLRHEFALDGRLAGADDILRAALKLGLKAKAVRRKVPDDLQGLALPCLVRLQDGGWGVLLKRSRAGYIFVKQHPHGFGVPTEVDGAALAATMTGEVILVARRLGGPGTSPAMFNFAWFLPSLWRYRSPLAHVLVASLFIQLFALATPLLFQLVVDKVLVHNSLSTLTLIVTGLIVLNVFECILQYLRAYLLSHTACRIDVELGARLFDYLTRLPLSYFETRAAGQIVSRVRELESIRSFLTGQGLSSIIDLSFSIIFVSVLLLYSPLLTLIVLCSLPVYVAITIVLRPILRRRIDERFHQGAACQQLLVESVIGFQTLKAAAVEPVIRSQWEERLAGYVKSSFEAVTLSSVAQNAIQLVSKTTAAVVLLLGARAVMEGDLTIGGLIAFNMLMSQATQPILRLSQLWQDFQQVQVSVERLGDILNHPTESAPGRPAALPPVRGAISFQGVTFRYRSQAPEVLHNINLDVPAGQVIGIIGPSGSGKSTLTKLLQRFYKPERGQVLVDGIDVAQADTAWLRRQIGVVQQEDILFNRTVHENIALANPSMPREYVIEVARIAGADEFISRLPLGYDTVIEERGANLSGGQRQRIAIARALANRPRILILDEATSALDCESERIIRQNLRQIAKGRTVLIIAHRLATVRDCDRIIALQDGKIAEDGTHESLLSTPSSIYAKLWHMQS